MILIGDLMIYKLFDLKTARWVYDEEDKMFYLQSKEKLNYTAALESCRSAPHNGRLAILKTLRQFNIVNAYSKAIGNY